MSTNQKILDEYYHDVEVLLGGADNPDRDVILQGLQEHVSDRLSDIEDPSPGDVRAIIRELGSAEAIAAEVTQESAPASITHPPTRASNRSSPLVIAVLHSIASLVLLTLLLNFTGVESIGGGGQEEELFFTYSWPSFILFGAAMILPFWIVCLVMIARLPLTPRRRAMLIGLMPTTLVVVSISPTIGWQIGQSSGLAVAFYLTLLTFAACPVFSWLLTRMNQPIQDL